MGPGYEPSGISNSSARDMAKRPGYEPEVVTGGVDEDEDEVDDDDKDGDDDKYSGCDRYLN